MPPIHCFFSQRYQLWMRHRYPQVFMIIAIPAHLFSGGLSRLPAIQTPRAATRIFCWTELLRPPVRAADFQLGAKSAQAENQPASPWFRHNSQGICFHGSWCGNKRSPSRHGSLHIASILLFQSQKRHHAASNENKLLQRQRCLCHQLKIPPRKLRCTESSRGNLWCQTACLSRYRLIWSFCFAADHPETQRSSITSTSFFSSNFFTQPRSAFPALVAATLASSFS